MNNIRKFTVLLILALLVCFVTSVSGENDTNLIKNGSFEYLGKDGYPENWYTDAYVLDNGYTVFDIVHDHETIDGEQCAMIQNIALNDARYAQDIRVEPETMYKLSGWIKADVMDSGRGANLSVAGVYAFSESVFETDSGWEYIEWYGETGEDQNNITVYVRVGGYSGESKGTAFFDDIRLEKVDVLPGSTVASVWFADNYGNSEKQYNDYEDDTSEDNEHFGRGMLLLLSVSVLYCIIAIYAIYYLRDNELLSDRPAMKTRRKNTVFMLGLLLAFLYRLVLSCLIQGYEVDVNCFLSWGNTMRTAGPAAFYESTGFCDYPPAYTYILGLNSAVSLLLKDILPSLSGTVIDRIVFRFVPCACDIVSCILLCGYAVRKSVKREKAQLFATTAAFCPITVITSAAWGQMDSVLSLCLLFVAISVLEHKWSRALPFYMLAVLIKPQALMLGFLGLTVIIIEWIAVPGNRRSICIGLGLSAAVLLIMVIPFSLHMSPDWLVKQYSETLASYPYATVNTANFYYLFGGNWSGIEKTAVPLSCAVLFALSAGYGAMLWFCQKKRQMRLYAAESVIQAVCALIYIVLFFTGSTWALVGTVAMAQVFLIVLPMMIRSRKVDNLPLLGGMLFILLYVFGIKMHERYLFPAFMLLALAYLTNRDKRILWVGIVFNVTAFCNVFIVLNNCIMQGASYGHLNPDTQTFACVLSLVNMTAAVFGTVSTWYICVAGEGTEKTVFGKVHKHISVSIPENIRSLSTYKPDKGLQWKKADTLILLGITVLYSVLSLSTLGSMKAPQTSWISTQENESVTIDLNGHYDSFSILYYAGVSRYNFSVKCSDDGVTWSESFPCEMDQGQCYKWKYAMPSWTDNDGNVNFSGGTTQNDVLTLSGRYVSITADQIGLTLNEVIFRTADGSNIPASVLSREGENASSPNLSDPLNLLDEQDTLVGIPSLFRVKKTDTDPDTWSADTPQPSWYNSTYFDEIYHARTGYEHLHGTVPYETSHPPLGKLLMSVCIAVFGMTPFGWRLAGAIAGILMLPGIYLLCKQLTKSTSLSTLACALLSLDCMHFTQTRIATIDSFPVLFIIFAYFFMLRFTQTDLLRNKPSKYLPDLAFSGFFMGLSIASKWIGIYAGAGLAVIFFLHCVRQFRLAEEQLSDQAYQNSAERTVQGTSKQPKAIPRNAFTGKFIRICLWCIVFFILVPLVIYMASYIPYFAYNRQLTTFSKYLNAVWNAQTGMFNYHSTPGLGMDHPFYSPWYEWPLIQRPMYYAMDGWLADPGICYAIFAFGNPAVWIGGLIGMISVFVLALFQKHYLEKDSVCRWHLVNKDHRNDYGFVIIGFLAQFLPWVLVPRGTYIYHYFASIPFLIIALILLLGYIRQHSGKTFRVLFGVVLVLAAGMFILFLPYASGMPAPSGWLDFAGKFLHLYH